MVDRIAVLSRVRGPASMRFARDGSATRTEEEVQVGTAVSLENVVDVESFPAPAW
jgi:hypothetical protein